MCRRGRRRGWNSPLGSVDVIIVALSVPRGLRGGDGGTGGGADGEGLVGGGVPVGEGLGHLCGDLEVGGHLHRWVGPQTPRFQQLVAGRAHVAGVRGCHVVDQGAGPGNRHVPGAGPGNRHMPGAGPGSRHVPGAAVGDGRGVPLGAV